MSKIYDFLKDERGVVSIEAPICILVIMILISLIYEVLKFQNDISMISVNEQTASQKIDISLLNSRFSQLVGQFSSQLNEGSKNNYSSALSYSKVSITCYDDLNLKVEKICSRYIKIFKFSYTVTRRFTNPVFTSLLSMPTVIKREVFVINDYYN